MAERLLISLSGLIIIGVAAQWLAWRFRIPSILLLLIFGVIAGPVAHLLDPDALLGDLLFPVVSLSVALILFEGGLSLRIAELRAVAGIVRNLIAGGTAVTWLLTSVAARYILNLDWELALLLGSILVVTGPTVIIPLLRHVRLTARVASILRWEGILIDPLGAILAVLVYEAILQGEYRIATGTAVLGFLKTVSTGVVMGAAGAGFLYLLLKRRWVPDYLQNPLSFATVLGSFTLANSIRSESGLLAVTLAGVILANQKAVVVRHIIEFKENLRVLLIAGLFILLAARLSLAELVALRFSGLMFLGVLILVTRPVAVLFSAIGTGLSWRERVFLAWMAPRGIVAAAVSSIFALRLAAAGFPKSEMLVSVTFMVIVGTVALYGLTAGPLARRLDISRSTRRGPLIVGAHPWAREIAAVLQSAGFRVQMVDANPVNVQAARAAGLSCCQGNVLSEEVSENLDLDGIGFLLALTPNDEVNSLAALHFADTFGRTSVYQLPLASTNSNLEGIQRHLRGRQLFGANATYRNLTDQFNSGARFTVWQLKGDSDYAAFEEQHQSSAIPLFLMDEAGELSVVTVGEAPKPRPGHSIIAIVPPG